MADLRPAQEALQKFFGYASFRPMQAEIIQAVYDGSDTLVLMPTGGGKSVCFQIPAITLPGVCLVVSPLISLMKDQVGGLRALGIRAAFLNSTLHSREQRQVENDLFEGKLDLVYVSPEKLQSADFLTLLRRSALSLIAIDEAHCISAWGHDFRPEYNQLRFLKREFPQAPIIALTATADRITRKDIAEQLDLRDPKVFIASFDRPNIFLEVRPGQKRIDQILAFVRERPRQAGIVYCLSRKNTEDLAHKLQAAGIAARAYHAGMDDSSRNRVQDDFSNDRLQVICATVAFGMGIDKSNVRWIIHYNLPKNVESYYQEIGRAGRDGSAAHALLFYSYGDVANLESLLSDQGDPEQIELKLSKLRRMYQYASGLTCRRKTLLSYFGEDLRDNCGHCDVCLHPPRYTDGVQIAQKALSAIARLGERVTQNQLIDVLRGSGKKEIFEHGWDQIKTYGAGRDISFENWRFYLEQLLHQGLIEIAADDFHRVKLTASSREVLFENRPVQLVQAEAMQAKKKEAVPPPRSARQKVQDEVFEALRQLRLSLARERSIPPYMVFSDKTLEEMADKKPLNERDFRAISGVGQQKWQDFGADFLALIRTLAVENKTVGATQLQTLDLFRKGLTVDEIARQRELTDQTVINHLCALMENGEEIDVNALITPQEKAAVWAILPKFAPPFALKPIFEALGEQIPYSKIRVAIASYKNTAS